MTTPQRKEIFQYIEEYNDFDVWECISKCEIEGNLDEIQSELEAYQKENEHSLIDLINNRFEDLVYLSKTLSGIKEITNEIKYPLIVLEEHLSKNIKTIKEEIQDIITTLKQEEDRKIKEERESIERQMNNCLQRLTKHLENPESIEIIEIACYELELLKFLVHKNSHLECVISISQLFSSFEEKIHTYISQFILKYASTNDQDMIDICSNCYLLLGEMDLTQSVQK